MTTDTTVDSDVETRVKRGAALLDQERPGWADDVNLMRLHMDSCYSCVLGQLYEGYLTGLVTIGLRTDSAVEHGFNADLTRGERYGPLDELWQAEITARREG